LRPAALAEAAVFHIPTGQEKYTVKRWRWPPGGETMAA
jgi:hypothetical protein